MPTCISPPRLSEPKLQLHSLTQSGEIHVWEEQRIKVFYAGCPPLRTWGSNMNMVFLSSSIFFSVYTIFFCLCICLFVQMGFVFCFNLEVKVFLLQPLECGRYTHPLHTHCFVLMFSNSLISVFPNILCSYRPTQLSAKGWVWVYIHAYRCIHVYLVHEMLYHVYFLKIFLRNLLKALYYIWVERGNEGK